MKIKFHLFLNLFLFLQLISDSVFAQKQGQDKIDSIITLLPQLNEDTNKIKALCDLSYSYYTINPDSGIRCGNRALQLSEKIKWKEGIALSITNTGVNYFGIADNAKGLECFYKSLAISEELKNQSLIGINLSRIGTTFIELKDYKKALDFQFKALKYFNDSSEKLKIAKCYNNIGNIYFGLNKFDESLEYQNKALKKFEELGDSITMAYVFGAIGNVYEKKQLYSMALESNFLSLKILNRFGIKNGVAIAMQNIGNCYKLVATNEDKSELNKIFHGNKNDALQQAIKFMGDAAELNKQLNNNNELKDNYAGLSDCYEFLGDYRNALHFHKFYMNEKDSVFNESSNKKIAALESNRKEQLNQKQLQIKDLQIAKTKNERLYLIIGASLLTVLVVLLFNRYRIKHKSNIELSKAYDELKSAQQQLIQSEKLAALGTVATRMAHEIQNPLNFVNNFSELSEELVHEIVASKDEEEKADAAKSLLENLQKINQHGKRASSIVKQLQDHSNKGTAHEFFESPDTK